MAGADENDDDAPLQSGDGDGGRVNVEQGEESGGSGGISPEDVNESIPGRDAVAEQDVEKAKNEERGEPENEAVSLLGPEEETPPATKVIPAGESSGAARAGDTAGGDGVAEEHEEGGASTGREAGRDGVAVGKDTVSPEDTDERVDGRTFSGGVDNLDGTEEPGEAVVEEQAEEDNVFESVPPVEVLVDEPVAVASEEFIGGEGEEEEGEEEDDEDNVFGPGPSVEVLVDEPVAAEAFVGGEGEGVEEEDNDNVFGPGPPAEVMVDEPAVAEAFVEGAGDGEEEDNVFGLTEPSEAVLGAKAAAREAFQGGHAEEEEEGGAVTGPTERLAGLPVVTGAQAESFTEEEEGAEEDIFGSTEPVEAVPAAEPAATELHKDGEEAAARVTEKAEEGNVAVNGQSLPAEQTAASAAAEGTAATLASGSEPRAATGGRGSPLFTESVVPRTDGGDGGGPPLQAQEQAACSDEGNRAEGPSDAKVVELAGSTPQEEVEGSLGERDHGCIKRMDGDNGREGAEDRIARAPDSRISSGGGGGAAAAEVGSLLQDGRGDGTGEKKPAKPANGPGADAGPREGMVSSGEGEEEGGEGRREDAEPEDGEDDVVFLQVSWWDGRK